MSIRIVHLFDNVTADPAMTALWGYSVLLEYHGQHVLMDTGSNGRVLLQHLKQMNIDPAAIDILFLSHRHWDHVGGLDSILELNPDLRLIVPHTLSTHLLDDLQTLDIQVTVVDETPVHISEGLYSTGTLEGSEPEQALVAETGHGLLIITGCAHPGLEHIVEVCQKNLDNPIYMIMGGFHLLNSSPEEIDTMCDILQQAQVQKIAPSHCTGKEALGQIKQRMGSAFLETGAGRVLSI